MSSLIDQIIAWAGNNAESLREKGIQVVEKFPGKTSDPTWKASLGLTYDGILVSYTVWERTNWQTELLVMNSLTRQTIVMDDKTPESPEAVHEDLDDVVSKLLNRTYKRMKPDPKLTVT